VLRLSGFHRLTNRTLLNALERKGWADRGACPEATGQAPSWPNVRLNLPAPPSNEHGTIASRIDILRAVDPGKPVSTIPRVRPRAEILLRLAGWPKVERILKAIDAVDPLGRGAGPLEACP
jgi:hypothetical protein